MPKNLRYCSLFCFLSNSKGNKFLLNYKMIKSSLHKKEDPKIGMSLFFRYSFLGVLLIRKRRFMDGIWPCSV